MCYALGPMSQYVMGHDARELRRLEVQARWYSEQTRSLLVQAGIQRGMRVVDFGCGLGDVTRILAELVGVAGEVVGVDRSEVALGNAARVPPSDGAGAVRWVCGDQHALKDEPAAFDAVVGRMVLMHQPEPVGTLRQLRGLVRSGGLVYFEEPDAELGMASWPSAPLFEKIAGWFRQAVRAANVHATVGRELPRLFHEAGLPIPEARFAGRLETGPESDLYFLVTEAMRGLLPILERAAIASASEVDLETLEERLRAESLAHGVSYRPALHIAAWTRVG